MSDSPVVEQLLERLARLEASLAERARIEVLTRRVVELEALSDQGIDFDYRPWG